MRTNTATTIIAFLTAPFIAFRRAFFPKTAHPRRLDEARAQERGHSLAIYTLFVITFFLFELHAAVPLIGGDEASSKELPLLVFLSAFMAFQFLASHREPLIEPRKIMSADFGAELVSSIHPRRHALAVDFIAYTSETLEKALDALRDAVSSGQHRLKELKVRVLVWDGVSSTVLPCTLDQSAMNRQIDCDYRKQTHQKIAAHTNKVPRLASKSDVFVI